MDTKTVLLISILAVCLAAIAASVAFTWVESSHPLAREDRKNIWLIGAIPYFVLGMVALASRRNIWPLAVLLVCTTLSAAGGTFARYLDMELGLRILDARAAGRRLMYCGPPPPLFFSLPLEYGLTLIAAMWRFAILPLRPQ